MTVDALALAAAEFGLEVMGICPAAEESGTTLVLIGAGPGMWPVFSRSPEYRDRAPNPLDRWSKRVIGGLAQRFDAGQSYPSDGPPYPPFIGWALRSGRFWSSPVGMLVHDRAGLMISLRGALHLPGLAKSVPGTSPCAECTAQPCRSACPVDALTGAQGYDVAACHAHLSTPEGQDCMALGCRARRACPVSDAFGRDPAQSAFHMRAFHRG